MKLSFLTRQFENTFNTWAFTPERISARFAEFMHSADASNQNNLQNNEQVQVWYVAYRTHSCLTVTAHKPVTKLLTCSVPVDVFVSSLHIP